MIQLCTFSFVMGHIFQVLFYCAFAFKMYLPLYKDGMAHILCNQIYFYVLTFADEFQLTVTLCNNNVVHSVTG